MNEGASRLQLSAFSPGSKVLGPGTRAVVWVQGCPLRCRGCVSTDTLSFEGGESIPIIELAADITSISGIEGVTLSGGEPFSHAAGLIELIYRVKHVRPELSIMSFSGYRLNWLRTHGTRAQLRLLGELDILIDGPYRQDRHGSLRWRGSSNQNIHFLTDRYSELAEAADTSAGLEFILLSDGGMQWIGVPPVRDFRTDLEEALLARGVSWFEGEQRQ